MTNSPCDFAPLRPLRHAQLDLHLRTLASDQGYNPDHSFALNTYSTVPCSTSSSEMSTHMLPHASPPATTSESYLCPQCSPSQRVPRLQRAPSSRSCTIFPPFCPMQLTNRNTSQVPSMQSLSPYFITSAPYIQSNGMIRLQPTVLLITIHRCQDMLHADIPATR